MCAFTQIMSQVETILFINIHTHIYIIYIHTYSIREQGEQNSAYKHTYTYSLTTRNPYLYRKSVIKGCLICICYNTGIHLF
uniref:Uncharacterized protein n=1 Tax=Anguilla anguilla TaxID=7936 RepID=A0A0E9RCK2_ANGAN